MTDWITSQRTGHLVRVNGPEGTCRVWHAVVVVRRAEWMRGYGGSG